MTVTIVNRTNFAVGFFFSFLICFCFYLSIYFSALVFDGDEEYLLGRCVYCFDGLTFGLCSSKMARALVRVCLIGLFDC